MINPENSICWSKDGVLGSVKCVRLGSMEMLAVLKRKGKNAGEKKKMR